eukprot:scaffold103323_cov14-Tisochrysis_lutea.AAC.2
MPWPLPLCRGSLWDAIASHTRKSNSGHELIHGDRPASVLSKPQGMESCKAQKVQWATRHRQPQSTKQEKPQAKGRHQRHARHRGPRGRAGAIPFSMMPAPFPAKQPF